jgi:hypothetical protein
MRSRLLGRERTKDGYSIRFNPERDSLTDLAEDGSSQISFECEVGEGLYEIAQLALSGWVTNGEVENPFYKTGDAVWRMLESFKPTTV